MGEWHDDNKSVINTGVERGEVGRGHAVVTRREVPKASTVLNKHMGYESKRGCRQGWSERTGGQNT